MSPYSASKFALEALSEALAQEVKPFNIRVAIVEPGIIDTPIARRVAKPLVDSEYPQVRRRFAGMFVASLAKPAEPSLVADKIREIIEGNSWQLRQAVGPDAQPFLGWRASMTDEEWVNWERWMTMLGTSASLAISGSMHALEGSKVPRKLR